MSEHVSGHAATELTRSMVRQVWHLQREAEVYKIIRDLLTALFCPISSATDLPQHLVFRHQKLQTLTMRVVILLPLLSAFSSVSLALALPSSLAPRQLTPPALPYPPKHNPKTCPLNGNLFNSNPFVKRSTPPSDTDLNTSEISSRTLVEHVCTQIAGFAFSPVGAALAHTYAVPLQPGLIYVVSVTADVTIQKIVAWAHIPGSRFGQSRFVAEVRPGQNTGTLQFFVSAATQVWFGVYFGAPHANGEIGLFSIGVDQ